LTLVLIGHAVLEVPKDPRIRHLGFLPDEDKFDAIAAAELLIMPSYYESLSMVALEAWALGRPVLANGRCEVLTGQCIRSNAGLFYETYEEFGEALGSIAENALLAEALGMNGRVFYRRHYDWPVIERKYLDMIARLTNAPAGSGIEPLPGWLARRRQDRPAASDVVCSLASGPVIRSEPSSAPYAPAPRPPVPPQRRFGSERGQDHRHRRGFQPRSSARPQRPGGA
jgi:hypothetical protein